jgi:N-acetylglucosamine-6-phosphate deacetylase
MPLLGLDAASLNVGGFKVEQQGGCCTRDDGRLAGGAMSLNECINVCVQKAGIPLDEALRMGTLYPAKQLGLEDRLGRIAPGYIADLVAFTNQMNVRWSMRGGEPLLRDRE